VGSTLALAHPLYYNRLVQLASTIKFVDHVVVLQNILDERGSMDGGDLNESGPIGI
jgi:hypothetical protein